MVQLDGKKGVLMSILKIGSASTLDIIAGIKARLPAIESALPPEVTLKYVGDQSGRGGPDYLNSMMRLDKWSSAGFRLLRSAAAG